MTNHNYDLNKKSRLFDYIGAFVSGFVSTELINAWFVSSLLLLTFKLCFFKFTFTLNISLLFILTFFSYIYSWYFFLQYFFIEFLRKVLPKSIQYYRDSVWEDLILEAEKFPLKKAEFIEKKRIPFINYIFLEIYIFLILFRMFLIQNTVVYYLCYFIVYFFLFFC